MSPSLLSQIRAQVVVDVDSMDPTVAARHTHDDQRFFNMTSNQGLVHVEIIKPERAPILQAACDEARTLATDTEEQVSIALDILPVLLAKEVYPYLDGHVLTQTSPKLAHNTEGTVSHAKRLVSQFERHGIPSSRVCIKIPSTPEALLACQQLRKIGINTLGTCLFSLPQALAASQAGCVYISPYLNELRAHIEPGVWKKYDNVIQEHPMIAVIDSIIKTFAAIGSSTLVMPASIVIPEEAVALAALRPHHLTVPGRILDELSSDTTSEFSSVVRLTNGTNADFVQTSSVDYLADQGVLLKDAIASDLECTRKLTEALQAFDDVEKQTISLIREKLASR